MSQFRAVHLCCGGGGLTLGFQQAGIETVYAFDHDLASIESHRANFPGIRAEQQELSALFGQPLPEAEVWTIGLPCEMHSSAGQKLSWDDPRELTAVFCMLLQMLPSPKPPVIFFENVRQYRNSAPWRYLHTVLGELGYTTFEGIFHYPNWGLPQNRYRWHMWAYPGGAPPVPLPTHSKTPGLWIREPWQTFGSIKDPNPGPIASARMLRGMFRRMSTQARRNCDIFGPQLVTEDDLVPTVLANWARGLARSQSAFVYCANGSLRGFTLLEARRAQGFPDDYILCGKIGEQWGQASRAVPPTFARAVGQALIQYFEGRKKN